MPFFFLLKIVGSNIKRAAKEILKLVSEFIEALLRDTFLPQGIVWFCSCTHADPVCFIV